MREDNIVERYRRGKERLTIYRDLYPEDPRKMGEMMCEMVCSSHSRYSLGDRQETADDCTALHLKVFSPYIDADAFEKLDRLDYAGNLTPERVLEEAEKTVFFLPLFLYDHSGITMSTSSFGDRWDSGQVGYIILSKEKFKKEFGVKRLTKKQVEKAYACMKVEVKEYDEYITGQAYGFTIEKEVKTTREDGEAGPTIWDTLESCWGFYGNAGLDAIRQEEGINDTENPWEKVEV